MVYLVSQQEPPISEVAIFASIYETKNIVLISEVPAMKPDKTMKWQCNIMIFWIFGSNICEKNDPGSLLTPQGNALNIGATIVVLLKGVWFVLSRTVPYSSPLTAILVRKRPTASNK